MFVFAFAVPLRKYMCEPHFYFKRSSIHNGKNSCLCKAKMIGQSCCFRVAAPVVPLHDRQTFWPFLCPSGRASDSCFFLLGRPSRSSVAPRARPSGTPLGNYGYPRRLLLPFVYPVAPQLLWLVFSVRFHSCVQDRLVAVVCLLFSHLWHKQPDMVCDVCIVAQDRRAVRVSPVIC